MASLQRDVEVDPPDTSPKTSSAVSSFLNHAYINLGSVLQTSPRRWGNRYHPLVGSTWSPGSIDALVEITDRILGLLEEPQRQGPWDRRGLVVGHVQSGKTANYNGLICKAADAGYKVIVVLAGIHNNLRSQTQMRLDEGFLGYESMPPREAQRRGLRPIGVGAIDPELRTDTITNRSEREDFSRIVARNFSINPGGRPLLFVVKKNARVLQNLLDWVEWAANSRDSETGRRVVTDVPVFVIGDEADHASVDTNEQPTRRIIEVVEELA